MTLDSCGAAGAARLHADLCYPAAVLTAENCHEIKRFHLSLFDFLYFNQAFEYDLFDLFSHFVIILLFISVLQLKMKYKIN